MAKQFGEEEMLAIAAARRFEQLFQSMPIACIGFAADGHIVEWNRACETAFGFTAHDLFGHSLYDVFAGRHPEGLEAIIYSVFQQGATERYEWEFVDGQGHLRFMNCTLFPITNGEQVTGGILAMLDMTAQKVYERQIEEQLLRLNEYSLEVEQSRWELQEVNGKLEQLAATDGLTGLQNHRAFQDMLAKEVARSQRDGKPLSLVMLDVDHFKQYNDAFGHPEGDTVLKRVATLLSAAVRASDTVARYGGEEFVVILPGAGDAGAMKLAERMRRSIEGAGWPLRQVTASFGVSTFSADVDSASDLIAYADKALYASKASGRNRVTHDTPADRAA